MVLERGPATAAISVSPVSFLPLHICGLVILANFHGLTRYERELNTGVRPPLRLIAAQDKPAGLPMVLCISRICWPDEYDSDDDDNGTRKQDAPQASQPAKTFSKKQGREIPGNDEPLLPKPVVEMSDGWYRVRVEIDDPMVRAIRRGALRVGMKVGVVGARVNISRLLILITACTDCGYHSY